MRRRAGLLGLFGLLFGVAALASDTEAGQVTGEITALTHEGKTIHLAFADVQLTSLDTSLERETRGELGLHGHWVKLMLHYLFLYKAKARPGWQFIPE